MQRDFSKITRVIHLILVVGFTYAMLRMAFGWSLNETARFMSLIVGVEYAQTASWFISLGPLVFLLIRGLTNNKNMKLASAVLAVVFNAIDMLTNVAAFNVYWIANGQGMNLQMIDGIATPPWILTLALGFGYIFCFLITWAEEVGTYSVGTAAHLISEIFPRFTAFAADVQGVTNMASGADFVSDMASDWSDYRGGGNDGYVDYDDFPPTPIREEVR